MLAGTGAAFATGGRAAPEQHREFIAAAFRMKDDAVRLGDQPYGAVLVKDGRILGFGPSRVVLKKDVSAHSERETAIQLPLVRQRPACERAAAEADIARMYHGSDATDADRPRRS